MLHLIACSLTRAQRRVSQQTAGRGIVLVL